MGIEKYKNYSEAHKTALQLIGSEERSIERELLAFLIHHYNLTFTFNQIQEKFPGFTKTALEESLNYLILKMWVVKKFDFGKKIPKYTINEGNI